MPEEHELNREERYKVRIKKRVLYIALALLAKK